MTDRVSSTPTFAVGRDKLFGHLAMIVFAMLIAGSFSLGSLAMGHIAPAPINIVRFFSASLMMGIFAFGIQRHSPRIQAPWRFAILGGLMAFYFLTMFIALEITAPVSTAAVFTLTPILTAFVAYIMFRQKVSALAALSLALAGGGALWVIFRADFNALLAFQAGKGELIYLAGCFAHAIFAVLIGRFNRGEPLAVTTFYILLFNGIWLAVFGMPDLLATDWFNLPPIVWITIVYLAIFPSAITFALLGYASRRLPASNVMSYGYLVPIFVIIYEGAAGHGWVGIGVVTGATVTCLGLAVLYFAPEK